jgi:tetratricopeptide (TPR) repeat protein
MRSAVATFEKLASRPGAKVDALMDTAVAYGSLGDELGQSGTPSLGDLAAALAAFHKGLELDQRIVQLNPGFTRALRGVAMNHYKIANVTAETDPAAALLDYRKAIEGMNALPEESRNTLPNQRILGSMLRRTGMALKEIGKFQEALPYMEQDRTMCQRFVAADPNDTRATTDLMVVLENEAECFEDRAEGVFTEERADRTADATSTLKTLSEARPLTERLLQTEPDKATWRANLGLLLIRMSLQQRALHQTQGTAELAARGVAILKGVAKQRDAQGYDLDQVATGLTIVMPVQFRDPGLAVECAQRTVDMSHHRKPGFLLTLAHAYRAAGQPEKARAAALEGLALLPDATPATVPSRIRKQLQAELAQ